MWIGRRRGPGATAVLGSSEGCVAQAAGGRGQGMVCARGLGSGRGLGLSLSGGRHRPARPSYTFPSGPGEVMNRGRTVLETQPAAYFLVDHRKSLCL